jgi:hypothetical protein
VCWYSWSGSKEDWSSDEQLFHSCGDSIFSPFNRFRLFLDGGADPLFTWRQRTCLINVLAKRGGNDNSKVIQALLEHGATFPTTPSLSSVSLPSYGQPWSDEKALLRISNLIQ